MKKMIPVSESGGLPARASRALASVCRAEPGLASILLAARSGRKTLSLSGRQSDFVAAREIDFALRSLRRGGEDTSKKDKDYIQIQTFPFSGLPRSALKSVTTSKTVIASARTKVTSTNHTSRAVRVLRNRVNLTPQLASTRRP